jgi:arsenite methyltransferase
VRVRSPRHSDASGVVTRHTWPTPKGIGGKSLGHLGRSRLRARTAARSGCCSVAAMSLVFDTRTGHSALVGRPDRWADWLISGRSRGLDQRQARAMDTALGRVRDRVLAGVRLRKGMSVLDVGAGTGLLAFDACRRVGESGSVIALDVSQDALAECRRVLRSGEALHLVVGDAVSLPLPDDSVDAVVTRSVLIYVVDKARVAAEFHRVLRPGGRVSIFEPINSRYQWFGDLDLSDLEPARSRVLDRWYSGRDPGGAMHGFDERDLIGHFVDAGFESVDLIYEVSRRRTRARPQEVVAFLTMRPNPNMVSYEEAAREVLGSAADEHLGALAAALSSRPSTSASAGAYLRCRRARN